jgi:hypothetical protein
MGKRGPPPTKGPARNIRFELGLGERIENAAHDAGRSFSEEVSQRVAQSFDRGAQAFSDPMTYALCLLLDGMIDQLHQQTGRRWHEDPWTFRELALGVKELIGYLQPIGEVAVPEDAPALRALRRQGHGEVVDKILAGTKKAELGKFAASIAALNFETIAKSSLSFPPELKLAAQQITAQVKQGDMEGEALADLWSYSL